MYRSVYGPIYVVCLIVFANCLLNELAICCGCCSFCVECDSVVVYECVCICWRVHVLHFRVCVYCVGHPHVSLDIPSIYFVCVCICQR